MSTAASKHDISRFGAEVVRFSPRQADLLLVAGTISYKQAPILKQIYDQMHNFYTFLKSFQTSSSLPTNSFLLSLDKDSFFKSF